MDLLDGAVLSRAKMVECSSMLTLAFISAALTGLVPSTPRERSGSELAPTFLDALA